MSTGTRSVEKSLVHSLVEWGRITGGVLAAVAAALVGLFAVDQMTYEPDVDRANRATTVTRLSHAAMLDQQDGLRGFLASGDKGFLDEYRVGHEALPQLNEEARRLIAGRGELDRYLLEMRLAQQAWFRGWADEVLARSFEGTPVGTSFIFEDRELFDDYRASYDVLIDALVEDRDAALQAQRRALLTAIMLALLVTGGLGAFAVHRNRALRRQVGVPLNALMERLEQIRSGDLAPRVVPEGPSEFKILHAGLEEAAMTLAEAAAVASSHADGLVARAQRQAEILDFTRSISGNLDLPHVLTSVCTHASAIADGARAVVWMVDDGGSHLDPLGDSHPADMSPAGLEPIPVGGGLVGQVAAFGRAKRLGDGMSDTEGRIAFPLVVSAQVVGVLEFVGPQVDALTDEAVEVLETMATHAASAIDASRVHAVAVEMAMTDALTGLRNRRRLTLDLDEECAASMRYARPLTVLMIDIDFFKSYNDTFGHQAGDLALQGVAGILAAGVRNTDHAYRFGGEEFVVVLRETRSADAVMFAERLRTAVALRFGGRDQLRAVTISIGVATMPDHGTTAAEIIAASDRALYKAKNTGRNRLVCAPTPLALAPEEPRRLGEGAAGA